MCVKLRFLRSCPIEPVPHWVTWMTSTPPEGLRQRVIQWAKKKKKKTQNISCFLQKHLVRQAAAAFLLLGSDRFTGHPLWTSLLLIRLSLFIHGDRYKLYYKLFFIKGIWGCSHPYLVNSFGPVVIFFLLRWDKDTKMMSKASMEVFKMWKTVEWSSTAKSVIQLQFDWSCVSLARQKKKVKNEKKIPLKEPEWRMAAAWIIPCTV